MNGKRGGEKRKGRKERSARESGGVGSLPKSGTTTLVAQEQGDIKRSKKNHTLVDCMCGCPKGYVDITRKIFSKNPEVSVDVCCPFSWSTERGYMWDRAGPDRKCDCDADSVTWAGSFARSEFVLFLPPPHCPPSLQLTTGFLPLVVGLVRWPCAPDAYRTKALLHYTYH